MGQRQGHVVGLHGHHLLQPGAAVAHGVGEQAAQGILTIECDHRQFRELGERDGAGLDLLRRQQAFGHHTNHTPLGQLLLHERGVRDGAEHVADVSLLQHERRDDLWRVQRFVVHDHRGMFFAKQAHGAGKDFVAQGEHGVHAQLALAAPGLEAGGKALHFIELGKEAFDVGIKGLRLHGGLEAAAHALEELEAELKFGVLQRAAHGRLRHVDHAGGSTHAAREHHGVEDFDMA